MNNKQQAIVMQDPWSESDYGDFILQQEIKLLQQNLMVSAAGSVAFVGCPKFFEKVLQKPLHQHQPNVFQASFVDAHLCAGPRLENIETGSVDWVILMHAIEQEVDARALLRDVTRVLSDGGRVSLFGFNPMRRWSRKLWHWKDNSTCTVESEVGLFRLQDWLRLLNYDVTLMNTLIAPNLSRLAFHRNKAKQLQHVNTYPLVGMVYHFEAMLRDYPVTMLRNFTKKENKSSLQLVNPSARNHFGKLQAVKLRKPTRLDHNDASKGPITQLHSISTKRDERFDQ